MAPASSETLGRTRNRGAPDLATRSPPQRRLAQPVPAAEPFSPLPAAPAARPRSAVAAPFPVFVARPVGREVPGASSVVGHAGQEHAARAPRAARDPPPAPRVAAPRRRGHAARRTDGARRAHAHAGVGQPRRQPRIRGDGRRVRRLGPGLRRRRVHAPGQRRLPVPVGHDPGRRLAVQGRDGQLDRELRVRLRPGRPEHRAQPRRAPGRALLLRPQDALHRGRRRQHDLYDPGLPGRRAWLRRRLGAGLPPDPHVRHRRRRRVHVRDDRPPGRRLRVQGRDRRELEQSELRGRRRPGQHRLRRGPGEQHGHDLVQHLDERPVGHRRGRHPGTGRQRGVGRPPARLPRHAVPHARRRGRGRHAGHGSGSAPSTTTSPR